LGRRCAELGGHGLLGFGLGRFVILLAREPAEAQSVASKLRLLVSRHPSRHALDDLMRDARKAQVQPGGVS